MGVDVNVSVEASVVRAALTDCTPASVEALGPSVPRGVRLFEASDSSCV